MPRHQPFAFMARMRNVQTAHKRRDVAKGPVAVKRRIRIRRRYGRHTAKRDKTPSGFPTPTLAISSQ
jgi:hypothetical protein